MKKFYITGFGRSGTAFLSMNMNISNKWTVMHEPRGDRDAARDNIEEIQKTFDYENTYGEVNSRLRHYIGKIKVDKVGVILRDPKEIFVSMFWRNASLEVMKDKINSLKKFNKEIMPSLDKDIVRIDFKKMVSDINYLQGVMKTFDVDDIPTRAIVFAPINSTYGKNMNFDNLPEEAKDLYNNVDWNDINDYL